MLLYECSFLFIWIIDEACDKAEDDSPDTKDHGKGHGGEADEPPKWVWFFIIVPLFAFFI